MQHWFRDLLQCCIAFRKSLLGLLSKPLSCSLSGSTNNSFGAAEQLVMDIHDILYNLEAW